jgi:hypothetical protein
VIANSAVVALNADNGQMSILVDVSTTQVRFDVCGFVI